MLLLCLACCCCQPLVVVNQRMPAPACFWSQASCCCRTHPRPLTPPTPPFTTTVHALLLRLLPHLHSPVSPVDPLPGRCWTSCMSDRPATVKRCSV
jgi:hypothetical protein